MRVLVDCRLTGRPSVGRYTAGLARALAAREDIDLVQLVARGEAPPVRDDIETVAISGSPFSPLAAGGYARMIDAARPDVTHSPHFPTPVPARHPLVVSLLDVTPLAIPGVMQFGPRRAVYRRWIRRAIAQADQLITASEFSRSEIDRIVGLNGSPMTVTSLAVDDFMSVPAEPIPAALDTWLRGAPFVLTMGNTAEHKDVPALLAAFQTLLRRDAAAGDPHAGALPADLRLVLAGPDVSSYLAGWLTDRSVADRARFSGLATDGQLRTLYERASVFAFPSRYEGFGLPPLEAMACGTPTIVADGASLPEVVGDGALTFPGADNAALAQCLGEVLTDPVLAADLARRGVVRASEFSWARTAEETVAVYRRAIAEVGRPRA